MGSESTINHHFDKSYQLPSHLLSTRVSSALTLYDITQHDSLKEIGKHLSSLDLHTKSKPSHSFSHARTRPARKIPSGYYTHKRRRTESSACPSALVGAERANLDGRDTGRRILHRSASLDFGRDIVYNTWAANLFQGCAAVLPEDNILKTDPGDIRSLWDAVSMATSRIPQIAKPASETSTAFSEKKRKAPSPYDRDFGLRVLEPRSITINKTLYSGKAHKHFEVEQANGNRVEYYTVRRGATDSQVWLNNEETLIQDIAREYSCMDRRNLCEAEFASYARETLLKRDRRVLDLDQEERKRVWIPERMIELVAKPTVNVWTRPPLVGKHAKAGDTSYTNYEFDLRPDCAYWLSLQAFNPDYRTQVKEYVLVLNRTITCPYLTIEFKRDDSEEQVAWNQVAAAAALALYNRFQLRQEVLEALGQHWDMKQLQLLRHYGMTFTGSCYNIWIIWPQVTTKSKWSGCRMDRLFQGDCTTQAGVRDLIDWINEIHCWGLTTHGPECASDVKLSLKARESFSGFRVSGATNLIIAENSTEASSNEPTSAP